MMTDYIAYLEAQKKMLQQFEFRTTAMASDTVSEADRSRPQGTPWRHGAAEALRAAASRLDPVPA